MAWKVSIKQEILGCWENAIRLGCRSARIALTVQREPNGKNTAEGLHRFNCIRAPRADEDFRSIKGIQRTA